MLIWGHVDLSQEQVFFNISKAQVQMDIIDEDEIEILVPIKNQPRPILEIVQDLFTRDYQHSLNQEVEQAFGVETHYQLGLLLSHFQDLVQEDSLS